MNASIFEEQNKMKILCRNCLVLRRTKNNHQLFVTIAEIQRTSVNKPTLGLQKVNIIKLWLYYPFVVKLG